MDDKQRDEMLWQIAKKRAAFKWSFSMYVFANAFLIGVWFFSTGRDSYFWPIWPILGWGIGILFSIYQHTRAIIFLLPRMNMNV